MRIGIHKLGFEDDSLLGKIDTNGMFTEVNLLIKAFKANGYSAEYVNLGLSLFEGWYDIIYVFNGFENSTSSLKNLKKACKELNYLLTDSRFYDDACLSEAYVDNYFVQSSTMVLGKPTFNSNLHRLPIFEERISSGVRKTGIVKNKKLIFGGSVREREMQVFEYVLRPNTDYFLRFDELKIDTRIPINAYKKLLSDYTYGIVLVNGWDTEIGNITWRYYEYIANQVLTFVDRDSDPYNLILDRNGYMYVSSYKEMFQKMTELSNNKMLSLLVLLNQLNKVNNNDFNGKTFVNSLLESREQNVR